MMFYHGEMGCRGKYGTVLETLVLCRKKTVVKFTTNIITSITACNLTPYDNSDNVGRTNLGHK